MKYRVYVWIESKGFDPEKFRNSLRNDLRGRTAYRKEIKDGVVHQIRNHWKSDEIEITTDDAKEPVYRLHSLLQQLKPDLLTLTEYPELTITAEIVVRYSEPSQVGGVFIPKDTIKLLSDVGACLDIDEYTD